jgi:ubiquinone/menaquinone biosynthesis C-methylase UbiE
MTSFFDPEGHEAAVLAGVSDLSGARVLEIGAGDGRLTWHYAARTRYVVGIDTDAESVGYLMEDRPPGLWHRVAGSVAEAENLPFARERFDAAVLAWSL